MTSLPAAEPHVTTAPAVRRRAVAVLGAVSAGLLVLAACDKPTPMAVVTVGKDSVSTEASCYESDDKKIPESELKKCLGDSDATTISVDPTEHVRFGVDSDLVEGDKKWSLFIGQQQVTPPSGKTYLAFPGSGFFNEQTGESVVVSIVSDHGDGVWTFKLEKHED